MKALNWKKRTMASLLALVMVVTPVLTVPVYAYTVASDWQHLDWGVSQPEKYPNVTVTANLTATYPLTVKANSTFTLYLNNYTINRGMTSAADNGYVFIVRGTLNIYGGGRNCAKNVGSGTIKGGYATNGGAIYVANGGTLNFYGGNISDSKASVDGGGVSARSGGKFYMYGGKISNCSCPCSRASLSDMTKSKNTVVC